MRYRGLSFGGDMEERKEYQSTQRYFAGELRPDQEKSWKAEDGLFVKYELFEKLAAENALLRRKIENHIVMSEDFKSEYNEWLDKLNGGE
jgi:hypothetical protein